MNYWVSIDIVQIKNIWNFFDESLEGKILHLIKNSKKESGQEKCTKYQICSYKDVRNKISGHFYEDEVKVKFPAYYEQDLPIVYLCICHKYNQNGQILFLSIL